VSSIPGLRDGVVNQNDVTYELNHFLNTSYGDANLDGKTDTTFLNGLTAANSTVYSLAIQADEKVLIGGYFTSVNGMSRNRIARLNKDGNLDTSFLNGLAGADSEVRCLALQADGNVLIGGDFDRVGDVRRNCIARLNVCLR